MSDANREFDSPTSHHDAWQTVNVLIIGITDLLCQEHLLRVY